MDISLGSTAEIEKLFCHFRVSLDKMRISRDLSYKIEGGALGKSRHKPLNETSLRVTQALFERA